MASLVNDPDVPRHPDPLEPGEFSRHFLYLKPMILERWPAIDVADLDATNGDPAKVVKLVAKSAKAEDLVRLSLAELSKEASRGPATQAADRLQQAVNRLESKTQEMIRDANEQATEAVTHNLWRNLVLVLGFGVVFGFVLGFTRR